MVPILRTDQARRKGIQEWCNPARLPAMHSRMHGVFDAKAIRRIQDGSINVKPLLSAVAKLEDGARWFQRLYDNKEGLLIVVLTP
ncbi:MAG: hypothetical protein K1X78_25390 [Verrucomicrobiaceae bacterium]|nr:hypothetical protein [Verrucomicrobiaceae bacterium]